MKYEIIFVFNSIHSYYWVANSLFERLLFYFFIDLITKITIKMIMNKVWKNLYSSGILLTSIYNNDFTVLVQFMFNLSFFLLLTFIISLKLRLPNMFAMTTRIKMKKVYDCMWVYLKWLTLTLWMPRKTWFERCLVWRFTAIALLVIDAVKRSIFVFNW